MRAFRPFCAHSAATIALTGTAWRTSRATFYDKIKDERDGSESDIESMFAEFPKSPHAQQVPKELHQVNRTVIDRAESLSYIFLGFFLVGGVFVIYYMDPFRSDMKARPDRSMSAQAVDKYGETVIR